MSWRVWSVAICHGEAIQGRRDSASFGGTGQGRRGKPRHRTSCYGVSRQARIVVPGQGVVATSWQAATGWARFRSVRLDFTWQVWPA
jgi:hypothetical protein